MKEGVRKTSRCVSMGKECLILSDNYVSICQTHLLIEMFSVKSAFQRSLVTF